jgi:hypothetical protein
MPTPALAPHFLPWVGKNYQTSAASGVRLLILGESHYGKPTDNYGPNFTSEVLGRHITTDTQLTFFTHVEHLVSGAPITDKRPREQFWDSVVFYNFVQTLLPEGRRGRDPKLWQEARAPFLKVLNEHRPHAVLVLGVQTWDSLSKEPFLFGSSSVCVEPPLRRWDFESGLNTLATWTDHPMAPYRQFLVTKWRPRVVALIERARPAK